MERSSIEGAEALALHYLEEEYRAEEDPVFADKLNLRALRAQKAREVQIRLENRELLAELRAQNAVSIVGLSEKWASVTCRHQRQCVNKNQLYEREEAR